MSSFRKILRVGKYIAFAVIFSIALSGCTLFGSKEQAVDPDTTRIVVWGFDDADVWKPIKRDFEAQNKGYTFVYEKQTLNGDYENRVLNSILSTRKPDIWAMPNDWVYRHKEKLSPLPDKTAATLKIDDKYVKSVKQSVYFDDKIYALAPASEPLIVYYNPKLFNDTLAKIQETSKDQSYLKLANTLLAEPPKIWSDFVEASKMLTKKNGSNIEVSGAALGTDKIINSQDILYLLMMQNETRILSENLKLATFNLPAKTSTDNNDLPGKRALEFYASFATPSSANYSWNDSLGNEVDAFANGKVAMIFGYSGLQNHLLQKYPNLPFQYRKAFMPQLTAETDKIVDYARFTAYGVSNVSKNPTAAWNAVLRISSDLADTLNSANRLYTSQKSSSYDLGITNRTAGNPERLSLATASSLVKGRYPIELDALLRDAIANVNSNTQPSRNALDLAANNATELLRKDQW